VPRQFASTRKLRPGDAIATEITAQFSITRGRSCGPSPWRPNRHPSSGRLHETAEAAFDTVTGVIRHGTRMQEILDAARVIEDAGFTVYR